MGRICGVRVCCFLVISQWVVGAAIRAARWGPNHVALMPWDSDWRENRRLYRLGVVVGLLVLVVCSVLAGLSILIVGYIHDGVVVVLSLAIVPLGFAIYNWMQRYSDSS